jgi:hypothetical protein
MINFVDSLNKGLELSQQADESNKEIEAVFAELNRQLNEVYSGKLVIERRVATNRIETINEIHPVVASVVARNGKSRMDKSNTTILIANWEQSRTGYPCSIAFSGQKHICEDKESLELAIADLLADPFVAKTLLKVINEK